MFLLWCPLHAGRRCSGIRFYRNGIILVVMLDFNLQAVGFQKELLSHLLEGAVTIFSTSRFGLLRKVRHEVWEHRRELLWLGRSPFCCEQCVGWQEREGSPSLSTELKQNEGSWAKHTVIVQHSDSPQVNNFKLTRVWNCRRGRFTSMTCRRQLYI